MCLPVKPFKVEKEWEHAGLKCAVVLAREHGHRCGYVRVPPSHSMHGKDYDDVSVNVHGGLTFANLEPCAHDDGTGWWLGFDCAHGGDASYEPGTPEDERYGIFWSRNEHFWTMAEVAHETEHLASQLAQM